ncbi:MAG: hypothetical protein KBC57_00230 [Neisseriaceae bacterium]|nr:hypothetical protein [Neisseriaceae bacterium]
MKKLIAGLVLAGMLSGCAELNTTLGSINSTLGQVNSALGGNSLGNKTYNVGNQSTGQYEIQNLKLTVEEFVGGYGIRYTGRVVNKTNKTIRIFITAPINEPDGDHYAVTNTEILGVPPKGAIKIDNLEPYAIEWDKGHKVDIEKLKITVTTY